MIPTYTLEISLSILSPHTAGCVDRQNVGGDITVCQDLPCMHLDWLPLGEISRK